MNDQQSTENRGSLHGFFTWVFGLVALSYVYQILVYLWDSTITWLDALFRKFDNFLGLVGNGFVAISLAVIATIVGMFLFAASSDAIANLQLKRRRSNTLRSTANTADVPCYKNFRSGKGSNELDQWMINELRCLQEKTGTPIKTRKQFRDFRRKNIAALLRNRDFQDSVESSFSAIQQKLALGNLNDEILEVFENLVSVGIRRPHANVGTLLFLLTMGRLGISPSNRTYQNNLNWYKSHPKEFLEIMRPHLFLFVSSVPIKGNASDTVQRTQLSGTTTRCSEPKARSQSSSSSTTKKDQPQLRQTVSSISEKVEQHILDAKSVLAPIIEAIRGNSYELSEDVLENLEHTINSLQDIETASLSGIHRLEIHSLLGTMEKIHPPLKDFFQEFQKAIREERSVVPMWFLSSLEHAPLGATEDELRGFAISHYWRIEKCPKA